jgi:hypothetical protein
MQDISKKWYTLFLQSRSGFACGNSAGQRMPSGLRLRVKPACSLRTVQSVACGRRDKMGRREYSKFITAKGTNRHGMVWWADRLHLRIVANRGA